MADVMRAIADWQRWREVLLNLFPQELSATGGEIRSELIALPSAGAAASKEAGTSGILVKCDHALPVTGTIKARGGFYEVLGHAENLLLQAGLSGPLQDGAVLSAAFAGSASRSLFERRRITVGSTGNLGFSVGLIGRALGFRVEVHVSADAKEWKKHRLRALGVDVREHSGDYHEAVAAARSSAEQDAAAHFVDDETSRALFLGYATAAFELQGQLKALGVDVTAQAPLVVYLPCGVGGAPGGISFALKGLFGDAVRCVLVEPTQAPCMLVQLAAGTASSVSIYDFGLGGHTLADGLAVQRASLFAARMIEHVVDAVVTVTDEVLLATTRQLWADAAMRLEPSGAAGFAAHAQFWNPESGLQQIVPESARNSARHLVWTTGGSRLPEEEFQRLLG